MDGIKKYITWVIAILFLVNSGLVYFNHSDYVKADGVLPKYYVDDDFNSTTPGWSSTHFDRIQDAINNATAGDRIIVYDGIYIENIVIDKNLDLFGEDRDETIIDADGSGTAVTITASNVDFSTFTIQNSGTNSTDTGVKITSSSGSSNIIENYITDCNLGIMVDSVDGNVIAHNLITDTSNATFFISSDQNTIEYNEIFENINHGIFLNKTCNVNSISNNTIYSNGLHGIYLNDACNDNSISNNIIYSNENTGIRIEDNSSNSLILNNNLYENDNYGVFIVGSGTQVTKNIILSNGKHGIFLFADDNTTVSSNNVSLNGNDGIRLQNSTYDTIMSNTIFQNERYGIYVNYYSIISLFYNNFFKGNYVNAKDISITTSDNRWNNTNISGSNIIHGSNMGGNYWDDYNGSDSNQIGLGDTPYLIPGGNKIDKFPLMYLHPVADLGGPYYGSVYENILFDASKSYNIDENINLTEYNWIFEDGTNPSGKTIKHNFSEPGNYSVQVTVKNEIGGTDIDTTYVIITPDLLAPIISVETNELVVTDSSTLFTLRVHVTDNVEVHNVTMKYWFDNSSDKITSELNKKEDNRYEKTIIHSEPVDDVFCIVTAFDISNNENTTENPFAVFTCKQTVNVSESISFDGEESFDLDGSIVLYTWDYGDGVSGNGSLTEHAYTSDGSYTAMLTVTDNQSNTGSLKKMILVVPPEPLKASDDTIELINTRGGVDVSLSEPFLSYDTNGDGKVDMFIDPNGELTLVLSPFTNSNEEVVFLISIDDPVIPELLWKPESDRIQWISYSNPSFSDDDVQVDYDLNQATLTVTTDKSGWIIIDISDSLYPDSPIKEVKDKNNNIIPTQQIWRTNDHIYILDDPSTEYHIIFEDIIPDIIATFSPCDSGVIDESNPSIIIKYNVPVIIDYAYFDQYEATDNILKIDEQTYQYTPPGYYSNGTYFFEIQVHAIFGDNTDVSSSTYFYFKYAEPPQPSFIEQYGLLMLIIGIILGGGLFYGISRYMGYSFNSHIYIKNRAVIPFIKPVVLGPLSISVDNNNVSKAEFYIDGELKHTVLKAPFSWQWGDSAFLNHCVEAKIFDESGKSMSSGEMSVFMINPFPFNPSLIQEKHNDVKKNE